MTAFVGLFDVLGFKALIASTPLTEVVERYRDLVRLKRLATRIPVIGPRRSRIDRVRTTVFSDTILIWCGDSATQLDSFLVACAALVASAIDAGWPLRGGIAYGDAFLRVEERIFVGRAIVDAYKMEQSQEWIGAAFHPTALAHPTLGKTIKEHDCVTHYAVPTGRSKERVASDYAVHWGQFSTQGKRVLERSAASVTDSRVKRKYSRTLRYINRKCRAFAVAG